MYHAFCDEWANPGGDDQVLAFVARLESEAIVVPGLQRVLHRFGQLRGGVMSQFFASPRLSRIGSEKAETEMTTSVGATLCPRTAFPVLMNSWPGIKGMGIRVSAVDTLGHLSLVITRDLQPSLSPELPGCDVELRKGLHVWMSRTASHSCTEHSQFDG